MNVKRILAELVIGYSSSSYRASQIFFKHFNTIDSLVIEESYDRYFQEASSKGLLTEVQQLEYLNKDDLWTKKDESELNDLKNFLSGLHTTKRKLALKVQIDQINLQIEEAEKQYKHKFYNRCELLDLTVENFCNKKINELYICNMSFKDKALTQPLFSIEEFEYTTNKEIAELIELYNQVMVNFDYKHLQAVAICNEFQNLFYLCDDDVWKFFGKPVIDLTFFQIELFRNGNYFKHILESSVKPPEHLSNDPEKLIEWFNASQNMRNIMEKQDKDGGATTIVGATQGDYEKAGVSAAETIDLHSIAKKKGGNLSMMDLLALQGGN